MHQHRDLQQHMRKRNAHFSHKRPMAMPGCLRHRIRSGSRGGARALLSAHASVAPHAYINSRTVACHGDVEPESVAVKAGNGRDQRGCGETLGNVGKEMKSQKPGEGRGRHFALPCSSLCRPRHGPCDACQAPRWCCTSWPCCGGAVGCVGPCAAIPSDAAHAATIRRRLTRRGRLNHSCTMPVYGLWLLRHCVSCWWRAGSGALGAVELRIKHPGLNALRRLLLPLCLALVVAYACDVVANHERYWRVCASVRRCLRGGHPERCSTLVTFWGAMLVGMAFSWVSCLDLARFVSRFQHLVARGVADACSYLQAVRLERAGASNVCGHVSVLG